VADAGGLQRGQPDTHRFPVRSSESQRQGRGHLSGRRVLAAKGITGFVLKYRLVECKPDDPTRELMARGKLDDIVAPVVKLAMPTGTRPLAM